MEHQSAQAGPKLCVLAFVRTVKHIVLEAHASAHDTGVPEALLEHSDAPSTFTIDLQRKTLTVSQQESLSHS